MMKNLKPLPGDCFVELEPVVQTDGPIIIPDNYNPAVHNVGRMKQFTPPSHPRKDHAFWSEFDIDNKRVYMVRYTGVPIAENVYRYRLRDILCIVPTDVPINGRGGVRRCRYCGAASEKNDNNMLLVDVMGEEVCPRCQRTKHGKHMPSLTKDDRPLTDEEERVLAPEYFGS